MKLVSLAALVLCLNAASLSHAMHTELCANNLAAPIIYAAATIAATSGVRLIHQNTQEVTTNKTTGNNDNYEYKMTHMPKAITGYLLTGASALIAATTYLYTLNNC